LLLLLLLLLPFRCRVIGTGACEASLLLLVKGFYLSFAYPSTSPRRQTGKKK
jgi:hypothetical protein